MEKKSGHRHPAPALETADAAQAFAALGAPVRLDVLRQLVRAGEEGLAVGALQERLELPASTLSHHLRALVGAGVLSQERHGRTLICRARYDRVTALADFLLRECCADAAAGDRAPAA